MSGTLEPIPIDEAETPSSALEYLLVLPPHLQELAPPHPQSFVQMPAQKGRFMIFHVEMLHLHSWLFVGSLLG